MSTTAVRHFLFIFGSQWVLKVWRQLSHLHFSANAVKHLIRLCPPDTVNAIAHGDLGAAVVLHSPGMWDFLLQCTHHHQLGFFTLVSSWALVCASNSLRFMGAISNFDSWALSLDMSSMVMDIVTFILPDKSFPPSGQTKRLGGHGHSAVPRMLPINHWRPATPVEAPADLPRRLWSVTNLWLRHTRAEDNSH